MRPLVYRSPLWQSGCQWCVVSPMYSDWISYEGQQFSCRQLWATSSCVWRCLYGRPKCQEVGETSWSRAHNYCHQPRCGPQRSTTTELTEHKVDGHIKEDRRVTVREIEMEHHIGYHAVKKMTVTSYVYSKHAHDVWYDLRAVLRIPAVKSNSKAARCSAYVWF
jgi:hypothetical protein